MTAYEALSLIAQFSLVFIGMLTLTVTIGPVPVTCRRVSEIDRDRESVIVGSLFLFLLYSCNHNFYVSQYNIVRCTSRLFCMYLSKEGEITWEEGIFLDYSLDEFALVVENTDIVRQLREKCHKLSACHAPKIVED
ncbi:hypothetical protein [Anoxybacillus kestanbolensis]|uniref:hypothetical protein n=1 Tax=Anoxybacillus kestanbolensis TaxID=227476 RepID=UPI003D21483E